MIQLRCKYCLYSFKISEQEFLNNPDLYKFCFVRCGGENEVTNLEEVIETDIEKTVKSNIDKWGRELGIEGCIELIERHSNYAIQRLYLQELKRRGWIK